MAITERMLNYFFLLSFRFKFFHHSSPYVIHSSADNSTHLNSGIIKNIVHTSLELFKCLTGYINIDLGVMGQGVGSGLISLDNRGETGMSTLAQCCQMCCASKGSQMWMLFLYLAMPVRTSQHSFCSKAFRWKNTFQKQPYPTMTIQVPLTCLVF